MAPVSTCETAPRAGMKRRLCGTGQESCRRARERGKGGGGDLEWLDDAVEEEGGWVISPPLLKHTTARCMARGSVEDDGADTGQQVGSKLWLSEQGALSNRQKNLQAGGGQSSCCACHPFGNGKGYAGTARLSRKNMAVLGAIRPLLLPAAPAESLRVFLGPLTIALKISSLTHELRYSFLPLLPFRCSFPSAPQAATHLDPLGRAKKVHLVVDVIQQVKGALVQGGIHQVAAHANLGGKGGTKGLGRPG